MKRKECEGCCINDHCSIDLKYLDFNNLICPCSICLVKSMCEDESEQVCEVYRTFIKDNNVFNLSKKRYNSNE